MVVRGVYQLFVKRTAETLEDALALVDSLPDVVVRAEIGEMIANAVAAARNAAGEAAAGKLQSALSSSRQALILALSASHDDTVVANLHFSLEFKYAVYLPIALPMVVPVMMAFVRQTKQALFRFRQERRAAA